MITTGSHEAPRTTASETNQLHEPQPRSIGEIVASIRDELTGLVHREIAIAKTELKAAAIKAGIGGAGFAVAGFLLALALIMLLFALAWGLVALGLPEWASFLIVAAVLIVLAAVAALIALNRVKAIEPPNTTIETGKGTIGALKGQRSTNAVSYDDVYADLYHQQAPSSK